MTVCYNAATQVLTWSGTDSLVGSAFNGLTFSETQTGVNLASITGSNMAYFGFAGADGEFGSTQIISNFNVSTLAGANNVLPSTTPLFIAAGGTLDLFGGTQQVASLSGSGVVTNSLSSSISTLTVGGSNTSQTFAGTLQDGAGTLALAMVGPGTLTLTGTNEYSGGTYVYSGTLIAANNEAIEDGTNLYVGSDVGAFFGTAVPAGASAASAANSQATAAVPEPGTLALVVVALSGAAVYRRRRSKTAVAKESSLAHRSGAPAVVAVIKSLPAVGPASAMQGAARRLFVRANKATEGTRNEHQRSTCLFPLRGGAAKH